VRLLQILYVILKHHLRQQPRGQRIREILEALGPIFVKFGQLLSNRFDLLPTDIVSELARLQDQVAPFCGTVAQHTVEAALGCPVTQVFEHFDTIPLASASIAQVHPAVLLDGREVVVKILRPNIHAILKRDIQLLKTLAHLAQFFSKKIRQFKLHALVLELEKTVFYEIDLLREAANASQLKRNFLHSPLLYIPEVHWLWTKKNVLVMERIYGIPISHLEVLKQQGFALKQLAERMIEIFFTQVFRDCFFHADPHPGNILVCPKNTQNPQYIAVDFGMMGSLSPEDQRYLAENILAFLKRDYRQVAILHLESGWIPKTTRLDEFEAAIRTVCEPILERPLKEISFGQLLFSLFQTASRYQINIQPQLMLLQKTLFNIEGLSRQLYPDIDIFSTAKPFLEKWLRKQVGMPAILAKLLDLISA